MKHFESVYHVYSWKTNTCCSSAWRSVGTPEVDTVTDVWPAADWHEREAWTWWGSCSRAPRPAPHPAQGHFIGHPLRKDYIDNAENHPHV